MVKYYQVHHAINWIFVCITACALCFLSEPPPPPPKHIHTPIYFLARNFAALPSISTYPPFSLKWKMGRHPSSLTVKGATFWKAFLPLTMAGLGGGGGVGDGWGRTAPTHSWGKELHQASPDKILLSREHIHLSPIFFICYFIDKDTNIFELWAVVLQRQTVFYLCVLCGPDSSGQCDLFSVIFWTTGRWQAEKRASKNTLLEGSPASGLLTTLRKTLQENLLAPLAVLPRNVDCQN